MNDIRRFYKELGNLFYAIAAVGNKPISPKEKAMVDEEVQYSWKHFEGSTDRFGSDRAYLIEFEFETMEESFESPEAAYQSFETYFLENANQLDEATRKRIFNSARHIAESVRKISKNEMAVLLRLKKLMQL